MPRRLRPLDPIYDGKAFRGSLDVANTPPAIVISFISQVQSSTYLNEPFGFIKVGDYLFITADLSDRVTSWNIANPASPTFVDEITGINGCNDIAISDNPDIAYVVASDGTLFLTIDISNPAAMATLGNFSTGAFPYYVGNAGGGYAVYSIDVGQAIYVANATTPGSPTLAGSITGFPGYMQGIIADGNYAYAVGDTDRLYVIDISVKTSPTIVGTAFDPTYGYSTALQKENNIIVSTYGSTLTATDVSNPASPSRISSFSMAYPIGTGHSTGFAFESGIAYIPHGNNGIGIYNVRNPSNILLLGYYHDGTYMDGVSWVRKYGNLIISTHKDNDRFCISSVAGVP